MTYPLILTASTPDELWREIAWTTFRNNYRLAQRFGLAAALGVLPADGPRPPAWSKLDRIEANLKAGCSVVWIDADCALAPAATLADVTPHPDAIRTLHDHNGINCGMMVFPAGQHWTLEMIRVWRDEAMPEEIHHPWWEQSTLHRMARSDEWRIRVHPDIPAAAVIHAAGIPVTQKLEWLKSHTGGGNGII